MAKKLKKDHLWSIERVRNAVIKGWITVEEYKIITGEEYEV